MLEGKWKAQTPYIGVLEGWKGLPEAEQVVGRKKWG